MILIAWFSNDFYTTHPDVCNNLTNSLSFSAAGLFSRDRLIKFMGILSYSINLKNFNHDKICDIIKPVVCHEVIL